MLQLIMGPAKSGKTVWIDKKIEETAKVKKVFLIVPEQYTFETEKRLQDYDLVVLGTPVWAGRCSSVMRTFLKAHGRKLERVAYVVTRGSDGRNEGVYDQMDLYTARPRLAAASLRSGSVGYTFWQEEFLRQTREILSAN